MASHRCRFICTECAGFFARCECGRRVTPAHRHARGAFPCRCHQSSAEGVTEMVAQAFEMARELPVDERMGVISRILSELSELTTGLVFPD